MEESIPLATAGEQENGHAWQDLWPRTLTSVPGPQPSYPPASFLQNPDGSKVCNAADSPGLGSLVALAWWTGALG